MVMLLALCLMIIKICNFKKIGINSEKYGNKLGIK